MLLRPANMQLVLPLLLVIGMIGCRAASRPATGTIQRDGPAVKTAAGDQTTPSPKKPPDVSIDDEPSLSDLTRIHSISDCDENGIPDSLDIIAQTAPDSNHNWLDDFCDTDTAVVASVSSDSWKTLACQPDTAFLRAIHVSNNRVLIQYTVPKAGADVRLDIADAKGALVRQLVRERQSCGAYAKYWDQTYAGGRPASDNQIYSIQLTVGSRTFHAFARWRWLR